MRVAFVYANSRTLQVPLIKAGLAPDTSLLGQNHLAAHGIEAKIAEPFLQRVQPRSRLPARIAWNVRELTLPWELGGADVVCTTLGPVAALAARLRPRLRTVLLNINLCTRLERAPRAQRAFLATAARAADAVVCFAEAQQERLLEQTRADPARVHLLPLGVDERFLATRRLRPPDGHVLAVGRDLARDYGTFAAAVMGLARPVVLVASQKNLIGVDLPRNVEVRLDVTATELRTLYRQASCVVIPTKAEGFPYGADCSGQTVLLDALAMSRPVAVSARETLREYADDGLTALVVPPERPVPLRAAIDRILGDDDLAAKLGAAGRAAVEQRFTTRALAAGLAPIIESVTAGRR
jgi:glycosyltransferase involved in cell wall biosynthesis